MLKDGQFLRVQVDPLDRRGLKFWFETREYDRSISYRRIVSYLDLAFSDHTEFISDLVDTMRAEVEAAAARPTVGTIIAASRKEGRKC